MTDPRVFSLLDLPSLTKEEHEALERDWPLEKVILGETLKENPFQVVKQSKSTAGKNVIVKCGSYGVNELNLLGILKKAGVSSVPTPLGYYLVAGQHAVSVMEYVPGVPVTKQRWKRLSASAKENFRNQLANKLIDLRKAKSEAIEGPYGEGLHGHYQTIRCTETFRSEDEYNEMRIEALDDEEPKATNLGNRLLREHFEKHPKTQGPAGSSVSGFVATHADLFPQNILMEDSNSGNVTAIIDFGNSGFYPEYMEYAFLMNGDQEKWWMEVMVGVMKIVLPQYNPDDPIIRFEKLMNDLTNVDSEFRMKVWLGRAQFRESDYEPNSSYCSVL